MLAGMMRFERWPVFQGVQRDRLVCPSHPSPAQDTHARYGRPPGAMLACPMDNETRGVRILDLAVCAAKEWRPRSMTWKPGPKQLAAPAHRSHRNSRGLSRTSASHVQPQARGTAGTFGQGSRSPEGVASDIESTVEPAVAPSTLWTICFAMLADGSSSYNTLSSLHVAPAPSLRMLASSSSPLEAQSPDDQRPRKREGRQDVAGTGHGMARSSVCERAATRPRTARLQQPSRMRGHGLPSVHPARFGAASLPVVGAVDGSQRGHLA